jgi:signal transduction protein with GAF and PtsI domain
VVEEEPDQPGEETETVDDPLDVGERRVDGETIRAAWKRARRLKLVIVEDIVKKIAMGLVGLAVVFASVWITRIENEVKVARASREEQGKEQVRLGTAVGNLVTAIEKMEATTKENAERRERMLLEMAEMNGNLRGLRADVQRLERAR